MTNDSISAEELQEWLATGRPVTVVDIRPPGDREWSIPGSVQIDAYAAVKSGKLGPLAEFDFPPGPVVTVCAAGRTALAAASMLRVRGLDVAALEGGMASWSRAWNTAEATIAGCQVIQVRRTGKGCLSYIVESEGEAVVIDASVDADVYTGLLRDRGWRLVAAADTHIHADHLSRSKQLAAQAGVELRLPAQERSRHPFQPIRDGESIRFGAAGLTALHTPGHTAESTTYLLAGAAAFTGETLFLTGVGRPDLEGGSREESVQRARLLHCSVRRLLDLPASTLVLPGHVSEPVPFDGRLLQTTVARTRESVELTTLESDAFVNAVLARIPPAPPNHGRIIELNERGEMPADTTELEAGANRCAVA